MSLSIYFLDNDGNDVEQQVCLNITHNLNKVVDECGKLVGKEYYELIWRTDELLCVDNGKVPTLTASMGAGGGNVPLLTDNETASQYKGKYIDKNDRLEYRKLTPLECERLQTLPDDWTSILSNTQRYKSIGNGWTIDVIAHILKHI